MTERLLDLPTSPLDPIMLANAEWRAFQREHAGAINTTIGVLLDPETGKPWRPRTVVAAYREALDDIDTAHDYGYQPQAGHAPFLEKIGNLAFGDIYVSYKDHLLAYQTGGGTGTLNFAKTPLLAISELFELEKDGSIPVVLDPGWPNHPAIFSHPFDITTYTHLDPQTNQYNHQAFLDALDSVPQKPILVLQTSGYNDDGVDRSQAEWDETLEAAESKEAIVVLDSAYLGLSGKFDIDRYPIRVCLAKKLLTFVGVSMSKNMGLYNERLGALFIANSEVHLNNAQVEKLDELMVKMIRSTISSPALLAAKAAVLALGRTEYYDEVGAARERLVENRRVFAALLAGERPGIVSGRGLFTKLFPEGFTDAQQGLLRAKGILPLASSRINLGGMTLEQTHRAGSIISRVIQLD